MTVVHLNAPPGGELPAELLEGAVLLTLRSEGVEEAELSFTFLPDAEIRAMNARWLKHDRVTDVISFPLYEAGETPVGDVYVGIEEAERQAREHGVSLEEELVRLVVHGTLHILGYDHGEREAAAGEGDEAGMFARQERIVARVFADRGADRGADRSAREGR